MNPEAIAKAKAVYGDGWEAKVKELWQEASIQVQERQREKEVPVMRGEAPESNITNSTKRRVAAGLLGHKKSHSSAYEEQLEIPIEKQTQICSEYAARSVVVTTNYFNMLFMNDINTEIATREDLDVDAYNIGDRAATFPISGKEKMSRINPAYLIRKWGRASTKRKTHPRYHEPIFKPVPPGDYAKYFHVP